MHMHCLVLNGNPKPSLFDDYLAQFVNTLVGQGNVAECIQLRNANIHYCIGCWSCWWKTPGLCAMKDDMVTLLPKMAQADLMVWASPLLLGTISALTKKTQDRFIPLAHPYIELVDGECHHRHRYQHNADLGLIVETTKNDSEQDLAITRRFFERFSRNTRTKLRLFATTTTPVEEAVHEALAA
jgi:multimeric flavodoxin WrbA